MERGRRSKDASLLLIWALLFIATQNLVVIPVMSSPIVGDQKNFFYYYPPTDPRALSPPAGVVISPPSGGSTPTYGSPPSHSGGSGNTPSYGTPTTPSHGSGSQHGHGGTPPANCGNPPSGHHNPTPAPPTSGGGGGYHYSPPTSSGGGSPPRVTPPTITPGTPPYDPHTPPFGGTCDFWRNNINMILGLFRWWGTTLGTAFGTPATTPSVPGFTGSHLTLQEALTNTRTDGVGALYREGTAALLNSMVNNKFSFTTSQVRDSFVNSVGSNKAAAAQARVFKRANEALAKSRA